MAQNYSVAGAVSAAFVDGGSPSPISLTATIPYTSRADFQRAYTAPVTDDPVDMGTLIAAGAKGVIVVCLAGSATIKFNGSTAAWPLAPGGHFSWCNPSTPYPTAALVTTTGPATIVFLAIG